MTDQKWLAGHSGQSTDELLALAPRYRIDSLLLAFEEALQERARVEGLTALTEAERTILVIEALEREVNNGGFHQLFCNAPEYAADLAPALERIGCPDVAAIARDAIAMLGLPNHFSPDQIERAAARVELVSLLSARCDAPFFATTEPIATRLFGYIAKHRAKIRID